MAKYKVGDKVRFLNDGQYGKHLADYKDCYGIVIKKGLRSDSVKINVYNNDGTVKDGFNIEWGGFCFYYSEIEPYDKPINPIRRFINAIIGWFCDPDSHSVNRYN